MKKRSFNVIICLLSIIIVIFCGILIHKIVFYNDNDIIMAENSSDELRVDDDFISDYALEVGEKIIIKELSKKNILNSNPEIISISDNGEVIGLASGITEITYDDNNLQKTITIEVSDVKTSNAKPVLPWDCSSLLLKSNNAYIYKCLSGFQLDKVESNGNSNSKGMQNFAITENYVYISTRSSIPGKQIIFRMPKSNLNNYNYMGILKSGHAQSFDVVYSSLKDVIFISDYVKENTDIPNYATSNWYFGNTKQLSSVVIKKGKNSDEYGKAKSDVTNKNSNSVTMDVTNIPHLDVALNYGGGNIAFFESVVNGAKVKWSSTKGANVFVYSLKNFYNLNSMSFFKRYNVQYNGLKQGVELCGNNLYVWAEYKGADYVDYVDTNNHSLALYTYNIQNGKRISVVKFSDSDIKNLFVKLGYINSIDDWDTTIMGYEAEGISIYGNEPYVGITFLKKSNNSYIKYNTILNISSSEKQKTINKSSTENNKKPAANKTNSNSTNATPSAPQKVTLKQQVYNCKNRSLKYGSKDFCVKVLKHALEKNSTVKCTGYTDDNVFRSVARNCVNKLKKANKLKEDGIAGPKVWDILYKTTPANASGV